MSQAAESRAIFMSRSYQIASALTTADVAVNTVHEPEVHSSQFTVGRNEEVKRVLGFFAHVKLQLKFQEIALTKRP
jgi:hypothetical protein